MQTPLLTRVCHNLSMSADFQIESTEKLDYEMMPFGPSDPDTGWQLEIPRRFQVRVRYGELGIEATLKFRFKNQRVEIESLKLDGKRGDITSRALTQLSLPDVIHKATWQVVPGADKWSLEKKEERLKRGRVDGKSPFLAQLYWLEHVSSGAPRAAIMEYLGAPRPTVNQWLREFKKNNLIPKDLW